MNFSRWPETTFVFILCSLAEKPDWNWAKPLNFLKRPASHSFSHLPLQASAVNQVNKPPTIMNHHHPLTTSKPFKCKSPVKPLESLESDCTAQSIAKQYKCSRRSPSGIASRHAIASASRHVRFASEHGHERIELKHAKGSVCWTVHPSHGSAHSTATSFATPGPKPVHASESEPVFAKE